MRAFAGALGAGLLIAIGLVYRLPGQLTWTGPAVAHAALRRLRLRGGHDPGARPHGGRRAEGGHCAGRRGRGHLPAAVAGGGGHRRVDRRPRRRGRSGRRRHQWCFARFFLLDVVPLALLLFRPTPLAVAAAAGGLLIDRLAFYGLAVQLTTEREIDRIDDVIRRASDSR